MDPQDVQGTPATADLAISYEYDILVASQILSKSWDVDRIWNSNISPYPTIWGETLWNGFFVCSAFRYVYSLHITWLVNSVAHAWGYKPYDKTIYPVENKIVAWFTFGEGFHNFHHTFPWDYKTGEFGGYYLNTTKLFIDFMAVIGCAYDLKFVSDDMVKNRIQRTGDGSY